MNLLLYMAPIATAALVPATLILEPNAIATARTLAAEHPCARVTPQLPLVLAHAAVVTASTPVTASK